MYSGAGEWRRPIRSLLPHTCTPQTLRVPELGHHHPRHQHLQQKWEEGQCDDSGLCFTGAVLFLGFILTTGAAVGGTTGQLHRTGGKVDLWVVLLKPGHT